MAVSWKPHIHELSNRGPLLDIINPRKLSPRPPRILNSDLSQNKISLLPFKAKGFNPLSPERRDAIKSGNGGKLMRQIRIAASIVGGTSLAVYMNGVAQELFKLATAHIRKENDLYSLCLGLTGSQQARIDIISGTSAGGINGLLLATALANGRDMEFTEDVFCELADIDKLFHAPNKNPVSLLQGDERLLKPLRDVFKTLLGLKIESSDLQLAEESIPLDMDLFITGSDLAPSMRSFQDKLNTSIYLKKHRVVFCFQQRGEAISGGNHTQGVSHLCDAGAGRKTLELLAERLAVAARVTSSLPGVFEPAFVEAEVFKESGVLDLEESCWMGDGGYLNARPLDLVVDAIAKRKVGIESVSRKVLLIEPKPDLGPSCSERGLEAPSALKNIAQSVSIMLSQSLESVLDDLDSHNRQARLVNKLLGTIREKALHKSGTDWVKEIAERDSLTWQLYDGSCSEQVVSEWGEVIEGREDREGIVREVLALERLALRAVDELYKAKELVFQFSRNTGNVLEKLGENLEELYGKFKAARELRADLRKTTSSGPGDDKTLINGPKALKQSILDLLNSSIDELPQDFKQTPDQDDPLRKGLSRLAEIEDLRERIRILDAYFQAMDILLFPLEYAAGLVIRDEIDFYLVDPGVALGLSALPPDEKLCGDAYFKFGGFLREAWRRNDILWGRLDGSAKLTEILLADPKEWALEKAQSLKLIKAYLGLESGKEPDRYGRYLKDHEKAEDVLTHWFNAQMEEESARREVLNLIALRHHLELLEQKLPHLLRAELREADGWGTESTVRQVLSGYFPGQSVEDILETLPARPLKTLCAIHQDLKFGSQDIADIPPPVSFGRLTTAIRVGSRAFSHSLPTGVKGSMIKLTLRGVEMVASPLLPIFLKLQKLQKRIFGKKSES